MGEGNRVWRLDSATSPEAKPYCSVIPSRQQPWSTQIRSFVGSEGGLARSITIEVVHIVNGFVIDAQKYLSDCRVFSILKAIEYLSDDSMAEGRQIVRVILTDLVTQSDIITRLGSHFPSIADGSAIAVPRTHV